MDEIDDSDDSLEELLLAQFLVAHPEGSLDELERWASTREDLAEGSEQRENLIAALRRWRMAAAPAGAAQDGPPLLGVGTGSNTVGGSGRRLEVGARIGRFELLAFIAKGGMGEVWEAQETDLRRRVALKLVLPERVDTHALDLFAREARAGGRLQHPNIVATLSHGTDDGLTWIAQELVEGSWTVKDFFDEVRKLDTVSRDYYRRVAELVADVAGALQAAHDAGVIHRDIKPANILLGDGDAPKLTDFGLARVEDDPLRSVSGELKGTWPYMSPEQARRARLDARTDVFSLGVVLYELLTLRRAFEGDTTHQIAAKIIAYDPPLATRIRSQCPLDLALVCEKALEKDPARRYQRASELEGDLRRALAHEPIRARPPSRWIRFSRWTQRNPRLSFAAGVGLVAVSLVTAVAVERTSMAKRFERTADDAVLVARRVVSEREALLRFSVEERLDELIAEQRELWPSTPALEPALADWLERAQALVDERDVLRTWRSYVERGGRADQLPSGALEGVTDALTEEERVWWGARLERVLAQLDALDSELIDTDELTARHGPSVGRRLERARTLAVDFAEGGASLARWTEEPDTARALEQGLELAPRADLWPLGRDRASGLLEFAHLPTGEPAQRRASNGRLVSNARSGVVLVLVPGGRFHRGAQADDPTAPNHDPLARLDESPVRELEVGSLLVSKYELTRAQWRRLMGSDPPSVRGTGLVDDTRRPVESISHADALEFCRRSGLSLPTETQWEYAARGGRDWPWSAGREASALQDREWVASGPSADWPAALATRSAPRIVGEGEPNPFGLYDVHGNVREWCSDVYRAYDGSDLWERADLRGDAGIEPRVHRGGAHCFGPERARSAARSASSPTATLPHVGLRPVLPLDAP